MSALEVAGAIYLPAALMRHLPLRGMAAQIPMRVGSRVLASEERIARLHELGARVDFWTINDPKDARTLLDMGADGIMTDDPKAIAPVFAAAS
jgi:glycerophosphoryl diester phosphodiesterase